MKIVGLALAVLGALALLHGGISYSGQNTIVDVGPIQATTTEQKNMPLSPIAAGIAMTAGVVLMVIPRKRPA